MSSCDVVSCVQVMSSGNVVSCAQVMSSVRCGFLCASNVFV